MRTTIPWIWLWLARIDWLQMALSCVLLSLVVGCTTSTYRYISLEDVPRIEIVEHGKPRLEALQGASSMPTVYRLERDRYYLDLRVNLETYAPALKIRAHAMTEAPGTLQLVAKRWRKTSGTRAAPCGSFYDVAASDQLNFGWGCKEGENGKFVSFDVMTTDGELLGQEDLPFRLEANGFYVLPDLL